MADVGYFIGVFLAAAGFGYIWLGLLWLLRIRKRWPRASHWSAVFFTALLGCATAAGASGSEFGTTLIATLCAVAFVAWRGRTAKSSALPTDALST